MRFKRAWRWRFVFSFSSGGSRILTASRDKTARVWDAATGKEFAILRGHTEHLNGAIFTRSGHRVITTSGDKTARIWDSTSFTNRRLYFGANAAIFSPDGAHILIASTDGTAKFINPETFNDIKIFEEEDTKYQIKNVQFSPDGNQVVIVSGDDVEALWDAKTGHKIRILGKDPNELFCFLPDGARMAAKPDLRIVVQNKISGSTILELRESNYVVLALRCASNGKYVAASFFNNWIRIWDAQSGGQYCNNHST